MENSVCWVVFRFCFCFALFLYIVLTKIQISVLCLYQAIMRTKDNFQEVVPFCLSDISICYLILYKEKISIDKWGPLFLRFIPKTLDIGSG